jgi:uncharacterized damage-inducible protein DinB
MTYDVAPLAGYPEPYGLLAAILQDSTSEWRGEIQGDPGPGVTTWRPRPGGQSIGAIILHMIIAELFWFEIVALDREIDPADKELLKWDEIDVDEGAWPDVPSEPLSWYLELHDRYRARTLEALKEWPSSETLKELHGRKRSMRWVLGHVVQHEAYHGGQIVMLYDLWKNRGGS